MARRRRESKRASSAANAKEAARSGSYPVSESSGNTSTETSHDAAAATASAWAARFPETSPRAEPICAVAIVKLRITTQSRPIRRKRSASELGATARRPAAPDPCGSRRFYQDAGSTDKTLKLYEGPYHDLLNDIDKEVVMTDIKHWIETRLRVVTRDGRVARALSS